MLKEIREKLVDVIGSDIFDDLRVQNSKLKVRVEILEQRLKAAENLNELQEKENSYLELKISELEAQVRANGKVKPGIPGYLRYHWTFLNN